MYIKRKQSGHLENTDSHTLLLLHLDTDIKDYSMYKRTFTNSGMINVEGGAFGLGCTYTDRKRLYGGDLTGLFEQVFKLSSFTVDFWVNIPNKIEAQFFGFGNVNTYDYHEAGEVYSYNNLGFIFLVNGYPENVSVGSYPILNRWTHVAFVLNNKRMIIYVNGIQKVTGRYDKPIISHDGLVGSIGNKSVSTQNSGPFYFCEFRVSDIARWTSNFTPPTQPY